MEGGYFTKNLKHFLPNNKENKTRSLSFLHKLLGQYPNQFNTVLDTLEEIAFDP